MTAVHQIHPSCQNDSAESRRKSAVKLVAEILSDVEFEDFLKAALYEVSGSHIQNQQIAIGCRITGKDAETIRRWIGGMTSPKAKDFWPVAFMALLARFDTETQIRIAGEILSMCGVKQ